MEKSQLNPISILDCIQFPGRHGQARSFLGDDYITPEEAAAADGTSYTDEQLEHFADTLPETQTILGFRTDKYILIPGPVEKSNLIQIQNHNNSNSNRLFYSKNEWHTKGNQKFAQDDIVNAGEWLAIRKTYSLPEVWKGHVKGGVGYVPNAPEVIYVLATYYKVRNIRLLCEKLVKTSSVAANGRYVNVGFHDHGTLRITNDHLKGFRSMDIDISSARRIKS